MMRRTFYLYGNDDEQSPFNELLKIIVCLFVSFSQKLSSVQKISCITVSPDKKVISVFCVSVVLCNPPQSPVQIM